MESEKDSYSSKAWIERSLATVPTAASTLPLQTLLRCVCSLPPSSSNTNVLAWLGMFSNRAVRGLPIQQVQELNPQPLPVDTFART